MAQLINRLKTLLKSTKPEPKPTAAITLDDEIHQLKKMLGMDENGIKLKKKNNIQPNYPGNKPNYSNTYKDYVKENIGKEGETATKTMLTNNVLGKKIVWSNMIINNDQGSTEIDLFLITPKGIFVIENKNYHGAVYGHEHSKEWKYYLNNQEYTFYNPIMQNAGHIKYLKELLHTKFQVECNYYNIVIFSGRNKPKVTYTSDKTFVGNIDEAIQYINSIPDADTVTDDEIDRVRSYLVYFHGMDINKKKQHIANVKSNITNQQ